MLIISISSMPLPFRGRGSLQLYGVVMMTGGTVGGATVGVGVSSGGGGIFVGVAVSGGGGMFVGVAVSGGCGDVN